MCKKSIIILLTVLLISLVPNNLVFGDVQPSINLISSVDLLTLTPGDTFEVEIVLNNMDRLVGGEIYISYDSTYVFLEEKLLLDDNMIDFTLIENVNNNNLTDGDDRATFVFGLKKSIAPIDGQYTLGKLTFTAIEKGVSLISVDTSSKLIRESADGNLSKIHYSSEGLRYNILGIGSLAGVVTDGEGNPIEGAFIEIIKDGTTIYSTYSSQDGSYLIEKMLEESYEIFVSYIGYRHFNTVIEVFHGQSKTIDITLEKIIPGDINGDGVVDLKDLVYVATYFGLTSEDSQWNEAVNLADVNGDGVIDILDLIFISRRMD